MSFLKRKTKNKNNEAEKSTLEVPAYGEKKIRGKTIPKPKPKTKSRVIVTAGLGKSVLKRSWVSEKAADLGQNNKYVFLVEVTANKNEVKKEISRRYDVRVESVNTIRMQGKRKRFGNRFGRRPRFKKAIVTLKEGQKIEIT